jgi:hypothetical protein
MEQEKKQAVALMRYSAIVPLITGTQEDYEFLSAYFRAASAKEIKAPDGSIRHYSPGTLENGTFLTRNPVLKLWFPPDGLTAV